MPINDKNDSYTTGTFHPIPIVIIPGDGGCQLEARWKKDKVKHFFCKKHQREWTTLWLDPVDLLPGLIDCWSDNIRLVYSEANDTFNNSPGVETRVPGFGETKTIESLSPDVRAPYFDTFVKNMIDCGYTRGKDIAAAPYDFRKTAKSDTEWIPKTVALIEKLSSDANKPVALVSHSMGSLMTLFLLKSKNKAWKETFVHSWTAFGGVFAGAASESRLFASGDNEGIIFVKSSSLVDEQRTYETNAWMWPNRNFWQKDHVLVQTPFKNYTVTDTKTFFEDIGFKQGHKMVESTRRLVSNLPAPEVDVYLMLGDQVKTPSTYIYSQGDEKSWFKYDPKIVYGNGDGVVNKVSLHAADKWKNEQKQQFISKTFEGIEHTKLVQHQPIIDQFIKNLYPEGMSATINLKHHDFNAALS
eukprot:CAMPEP_0204823072 /NCGR_PEP_ID=MMETSP1346-20131115/1220_1 /ASSEMBLY_ACC=CAM_ASM_000771 /TAXON_ID=215587 /ORGANISM="Aplanochytrium stocchinoi, Strain GSBS06" /LENGTH=413 /DNA_ID=CAMNT_0051949605 /DNA_START=138 /DNA_END=1379 /DNA_ORIENTATION=+